MSNRKDNGLTSTAKLKSISLKELRPSQYWKMRVIMIYEYEER